MPTDLTTIAVLAPIAFLGSFVYGFAGFGAGVLTVPLASHVYAMPFVLAVFALLDSVNAIRACLARSHTIVCAEAVRLVPSCAVGVGLGVGLLLILPPWVLMLALGVFVLAYALYSLCSPRTLPTVTMRWAYLAGLSGGIASAMFGAGGPPYAIYLSMRPHNTDQMRATLAVTSLVSVVTRIVVFAYAGLLSSWIVWSTALAVVPASLLALWCADRVHTRLSRAAVLRAIRLLLCLSGASLVLRALQSG